MGRKRYFVRKDPVDTHRMEEWVEMDGEDYYKFLHTDKARERYFIRLDNCGDPEADVIYMEVSEKEYRDWRIDNSRRWYYRKRNHLYRKIKVSLNAPADIISENNLTIEDITKLDNPSIEEYVIEKMQIQDLHRAISMLTSKDQELLKMRFWDSMSYREIADAIGTSVQNVHQRLNRLYKKLKRVLDGK